MGVGSVRNDYPSRNIRADRSPGCSSQRNTRLGSRDSHHAMVTSHIQTLPKMHAAPPSWLGFPRSASRPSSVGEAHRHPSPTPPASGVAPSAQRWCAPTQDAESVPTPCARRLGRVNDRIRCLTRHTSKSTGTEPGYPPEPNRPETSPTVGGLSPPSGRISHREARTMRHPIGRRSPEGTSILRTQERPSSSEHRCVSTPKPCATTATNIKTFLLVNAPGRRWRPARFRR